MSRCPVWCLALAVLASLPVAAREGGGSLGATITIDRPLIVVTKPAPPFAMKTENGGWTGLSIELWDRVARHLGVKYELREASIEEMLDGLEDGKFDVSVAAMTVTTDREARVDFTHPFHTTGLAIAVRADDRTGWFRALEAFFSLAFLRVLLALAALLLTCGFLVWLFERRHNPEMFGGSTARGVGSGFWWAAVTMTTVGYGDKAPQTIGGRVVALVWMFASLIVISGFTAAIASALTLGRLDSPIEGPDDLSDVRVGTVPGTTSAIDLEDRGLAFVASEDVSSGLEALAQGKIEAFVYDRPILLYAVRHRFAGTLVVLPVTFGRQDYAFAVQPDSALREPINRAVLDLVAGVSRAEWNELERKYLD